MGLNFYWYRREKLFLLVLCVSWVCRPESLLVTICTAKFVLTEQYLARRIYCYILIVSAHEIKKKLKFLMEIIFVPCAVRNEYDNSHAVGAAAVLVMPLSANRFCFAPRFAGCCQQELTLRLCHC